MNMTPNISTKEKLLSILDDVEMIFKEVLENAVNGKHQKINGAEQLKLTKLLIEKQNELKETLEVAEEQCKVHEQMNTLMEDMQRHDQYIKQFECQVKDAEQILATANFQAKQKLQSIEKASKKTVASEELIKYAHKISASEAICAPLSWIPGDPRRPYPTDIDMRLGLLTRFSDPPINGNMIPQQGNLPDIHRTGHPGTADPSSSINNPFTWHPAGEIHMTVPGQGSVQIDSRNHSKDNEDVEVMSTDSSSSSSSDSQ